MEGAPHNSPRSSGKPGHAEGPVFPQELQGVDPGLKRMVILLKQFARKGGSSEGVPLRGANPSGDDVQSKPVSEMRSLEVA